MGVTTSWVFSGFLSDFNYTECVCIQKGKTVFSCLFLHCVSIMAPNAKEVLNLSAKQGTSSLTILDPSVFLVLWRPLQCRKNLIISLDCELTARYNL